MSLPILDNHVQEFLPKVELLEEWNSAYRLSITGVLESRRTPNGSSWKGAKLGDTWKPIARIPTRGYGVLMVSLCKDKQQRAMALKELVCNTFICQLRLGEWVRCIDGDETNVCVANLEIMPSGKYTRRRPYGEWGKLR